MGRTNAQNGQEQALGFKWGESGSVAAVYRMVTQTQKRCSQRIERCTVRQSPVQSWLLWAGAR